MSYTIGLCMVNSNVETNCLTETIESNQSSGGKYHDCSFKTVESNQSRSRNKCIICFRNCRHAGFIR